MVIKNVNIGLLIEQRMNELGLSKSEFARKINMPSQNVNRIFAKNSIDTDKLILISVALDYDFFKEFSPGEESDKVTVGNVDHSAVAVGSHASAHTEQRAQQEQAVLKERVAMLEKLLDEKERLIGVLMDKR